MKKNDSYDRWMKNESTAKNPVKTESKPQPVIPHTNLFVKGQLAISEFIDYYNKLLGDDGAESATVLTPLYRRIRYRRLAVFTAIVMILGITGFRLVTTRASSDEVKVINERFIKGTTSVCAGPALCFKGFGTAVSFPKESRVTLSNIPVEFWAGSSTEVSISVTWSIKDLQWWEEYEIKNPEQAKQTTELAIIRAIDYAKIRASNPFDPSDNYIQNGFRDAVKYSLEDNRSLKITNVSVDIINFKPAPKGRYDD